MEYRFKSDEWQSLAPAQKVQRCRMMAKEARVLADSAPPDLAASYLRLAEDWQMLAIDIERTANPAT